MNGFEFMEVFFGSERIMAIVIVQLQLWLSFIGYNVLRRKALFMEKLVS